LVKWDDHQRGAVIVRVLEERIFMNAKHTSGFDTVNMLTLCLAVISFEVSAVEPGVSGGQTSTNINVTSPSNWTVLSKQDLVIPSGQIWQCVATGSADAENPMVNVQYRFTLTIDDTAPSKDGACERTLTLHDVSPAIAGIKDVHSISSTCLFKPVSAGTHTIRWLALKAYWPFADPDKVLTVLDNSLTIVCSHFQLVLQPK
jgi:hypothetical protein